MAWTQAELEKAKSITSQATSPVTSNRTREDFLATRQEASKNPSIVAPKPTTSKFGQIASGVVKGGLEFLKQPVNVAEDIAKNKNIVTPMGFGRTLAEKIGIGPKEKSSTEILQSKYETEKGLEPGTALEAKTPLEKGAKIGTEIASSFIPVGGKTAEVKSLAGVVKKGGKEIIEGVETALKGKSKGALDLSADELKRINTKKLKYLSKDVLAEEGRMIGGAFKEAAYETKSKVKPLLDEFGHLLTGKPTENVVNVRNFMKDTFKKSLDLFKGNNKLINKNTALKKLSEDLKNDPEAIYGKDFQEVSDKTVKKFLSYVKKGTAEGWEEARNKWYQSVKSSSDNKLNQANKTLHESIKNVIKSTLPKEKQASYEAFKKTVAKANDVKEILKAKIKASEGKSFRKSVIKTLKNPLVSIPASVAGGAIVGSKF